MTPVVEYPGGTVKVKIVFEPLTLSGKIYVWVHASGYSSAAKAVAHRPLSSTNPNIRVFFMSSPFRAENEIAPGKLEGVLLCFHKNRTNPCFQCGKLHTRAKIGPTVLGTKIAA